MKKITLLLMLLMSLSISAQVLNEPANWPNTNWTVTGTFNAAANVFESDPTTTANFAYDDDDSGSGTDDEIAAESQVIDITAAFTAGETWLTVSGDYVHRYLAADNLIFQYWDADASTWNNWGVEFNTTTAAAPFDNFCGGTAETYTIDVLNIAAFTATQLSGFKYRIYYNDDLAGADWNYGFCFTSPTIQSQTPPTCPDPTGLVATTTGDSTADIVWGIGGSETQWEITIQTPGTGEPTTNGTVTNSNAPYMASALTPSTAYEVYIRANCNANGYSNWIGPVNFTTFNTPPPAPTGVTCASGTPSIIFTETFGTDPDTDPSGWTGTGFGGSNGNWDITNPGGNSGGTGPANTYDGNPGTHLEYEASGDSSTIASAISPAIDLTLATDGAELAFWMHAFGEDFGTLNVNIGTSATGPFTTLYTWVGDLQTSDTEQWVPIGINLDAYLGQIVYLEYSYGGAGTGWEGDMSIDQITVETCGSFCIAPSNIVAVNITDTTADISWTANNGETQWEYFIQPAGTGTPTGAGTITNTPGFMATGLTGLSAYEVYVLADCGGGSQSIWAGPYNFNSDVQLNFTVDCAVGPQNIVYCYENNDTNVFTFTSTDGTPLNFTINSGNVENNWDDLVVLDTDGVTNLNAATPYGSGGDVSSITYQSTGDTISFTVNADFTIDCQTSAGINPLDITVSCATCINPAATYQVVDDCANGDQFLVDVNITTLGDATSLEIQDNQGNPPVSVSVIGVEQFGPYPFNTNISFTVSNEQDPNCVITSPVFSLAACPPDNDNCGNATVAVVNDSFLCETSTPGTILEATPSGESNPSCGGNPDDDVWFQFVATSELQLIALANIQGSNTFNIDHALYEGTCGGLVELACTDAELASVTPTLVIGNTYYLRVYSGGGNPETTTFDLCITAYETPSNITCTDSENLCPAGDNGNALYTPNVFGMPNSSSVACLGSIPNPTYSVLEVGSTGDILVQIVQNTAFDINGNPIGEGLDVDYVLWGPFGPDEDYCNLNLEVDCPSCPNNTTDPNFYPFGNIADCSYSFQSVENFTLVGATIGEIYLILVTNFNGDPGVIQISQTNLTDPSPGTLTSDINVELISNDTAFTDDDSDPATPSIANLCGFNSITLEADSPFADVFEWSVNGIFDPTLTGSSITVTESNSYSVTAYDLQCMGNNTTTVIVNLYQEAIVSVVPADEVTIVTCDDESGDSIEDFDFTNLESIILSDPGQNAADFLITYHTTLNDAQIGQNALSMPYSAIDGTTIYVRVEDLDSVGSGSGCASTNTTFNLVVLGALPTITGVEDLELCDDDSRDAVEPFDLELNTAAILNGQDPAVFNVSYHISQTDADLGLNALVSPYENTSNSQTIYARIENTAASDCYKTTTFDLIVTDIPVTSFATDFDYEVCPNATVPIIVTATPENYAEADVSIIWENDSVLVSGQNSLSIDNVLTAGIYTITVTNSVTGCISSTDIEIIELENCIIPQGISPNGDGLNDTFDLSSFDVQSLQIFNRYGRLVFEKNGYTNEWQGQSLDGVELPVGTYYYVMNYEGTKTKAAWVYINR